MYHQLARILAGRNRRKIRPNTYLVADIDLVGDPIISVIFHATTIVKAHADGRIWLNSGGWRTVTTKDRLNHVLPAWLRVHQTNYAWFISNRVTGDEIPFEDRMTLTGEGVPA